MTSPEAETQDPFQDRFISFEEVLQRKSQKEPSFDERSQRQIKRGVFRAGETLLGLPGDIVQSIRSLAGALPGGIQPEEEQTFVQRGLRGALEGLPGSAELRAQTAEKFPELEPQTEFEEISDEVVSDIASLAIPVKGKIPFARAIGLSAFGNIGKQGIKALGFDPGTQDATKLGLMIFGGMFGKGRGINTHIKNLYSEAERFIPEGATTSYPVKKVAKFENLIKRGTINDAKEPALKILEDIKAKIPQGTIDIKEAVEFDKNINRAISQAHRSGDKSKGGWLKQLKSVHSSALDEYAEQNPSWGENWKSAKQAYQGITRSASIQDFIKRNANIKNVAHASILLGLEQAAIPGMILEKAGLVGVSAGGLYAAEVAKRLATNPALRKFYENVLSASLNENKAMLTRNLNGLERAAKKEFEENPFPTFDLERDID